MMYIKNLMEKNNMTLSELSEISDVPESTLRDIMNGTSQIDQCKALTLALIAAALDTTVEDILVHAFDEYLDEIQSCQESPEIELPEEEEEETQDFLLPMMDFLKDTDTCKEENHPAKTFHITVQIE